MITNPNPRAGVMEPPETYCMIELVPGITARGRAELGIVCQTCCLTIAVAEIKIPRRSTYTIAAAYWIEAQRKKVEAHRRKAQLKRKESKR